MALYKSGLEQFMEPVGATFIGAGDLVNISFAVVSIIQSGIYGRIAFFFTAGSNIIWQNGSCAVTILHGAWITAYYLAGVDRSRPESSGQFLWVQQVKGITALWLL